MRKTAATITLVSALLISALAGLVLVDSAKANGVPLTYLPEITINSNGTITPETNLINRTGFTYTLTGNVDGYVIKIMRSNIVFDGAGYTINSTNGDNPGLGLSDVNGVTVKNLEVVGRYTSIKLYFSSKCLLTGVKTDDWVRLIGDFNTITESNTRLNVHGSNNLFIKNNVHELYIYGSNNRFYQNNFFLADFPGITRDNFWDNGAVGNYWSNYSIKYPNASEIGNTGIGGTPYVIERAIYPGLNDPDATNVDNYPLMYPWGAPEIALLGMQNATYSGSCFLNFTVSKSVVWMGYSLDGQDNVTVTGNVTLSELSSGLHNVMVYAEDPFGHVGISETLSFTVTEPFPVVPVAAVSVFSVVLVCVGLLVYFKKRRK